MDNKIKYITEKDYKRIQSDAEKVMMSIPQRYCRLRKEDYERTIINGISKAKGRTEGKIDKIIYVKNTNLGNKKYPYMIAETFYEDFKECREAPRSYIVDYKYGKTVIRKDSIIAFIKK